VQLHDAMVRSWCNFIAEFSGISKKRASIVNYEALLRSDLVALLRNKMRSILMVLGIAIGIAAVICVVASGIM
jgi:hypothetical protein